jgi:hypothetical protein
LVEQALPYRALEWSEMELLLGVTVDDKVHSAMAELTYSVKQDYVLVSGAVVFVRLHNSLAHTRDRRLASASPLCAGNLRVSCDFQEIISFT